MRVKWVAVSAFALLASLGNQPAGAQRSPCSASPPVHIVNVEVTDDSFTTGADAPKTAACVENPIVWVVRNNATKEIKLEVKQFKHSNQPKTLRFENGGQKVKVPVGALGVIVGYFPRNQHSGSGSISIKYTTKLEGKGHSDKELDPELEVDNPPPLIPPKKGK